MTRSRTATLFIIGILTLSILLHATSLVTYRAESNNTVNDSADAEPQLGNRLAELNLERVDWKQNNFPNGGFEDWTNVHNPAEIYTYTNYEQYGWYASAPWPVSEGGRSFGLQVRGNYPDSTAEHRLGQQTQSSWINPTNTTVKFDFYIDETPASSTDWGFYLELRLGYRYIYYYLGMDGDGSNSSSRAYYPIDGNPDTWNAFDRNITEDYYAVFSEYPTEFRTAYFYVTTHTDEYARIFLDDFYLINGTEVRIGGSINNGDFESSGSWYVYSPTDRSFIYQSSDRIDGEWSLNATSTSLGNRSQCRFSSSLDERLTAQNPDTLQLWWKIDDWAVYDSNTYAYIVVYASNATEEFTLYYPIAYSGEEPSWISAGAVVVEPTGFNTTGSWFLLNTSIWDDITAFNQTDELFVEELRFRMETRAVGARSVVLFDELQFVSSALNDRGYEDQNAVGEPIQGWGGGYKSGPSHFTVTDQTFNGNKAANLTVTDGDSYYEQQDINYRPLNSNTETYLQFSWNMKDFTGLESDEIGLSVYFEDVGIHYLFGNGSTSGEYGENDYTVLLNSDNVKDTWFTEVRSLYHDYVDGFGSAPDTHVMELHLYADSDTGGRVEIQFDDFYLYDDVAPEVSFLEQNPPSPQANEGVDVTAEVYDVSIDAVMLEYRVNEGTWTSALMAATAGSNYTAHIPGQDHGSVVEYYIWANDTFGQTTSALNDSAYFTYDSLDTLAPDVSISSPANGSSVDGVVTVQVSASDSGSGVERVEFYLNGTLQYNDSASPFSYQWDTTSLADVTYSVTARAYDGAGNWAEVTHYYTISRTETTTTTTTTSGATTSTTAVPPGDLTGILILVVVVGLIVVTVIFIYSRRRE